MSTPTAPRRRFLVRTATDAASAPVAAPSALVAPRSRASATRRSSTVTLCLPFRLPLDLSLCLPLVAAESVDSGFQANPHGLAQQEGNADAEGIGGVSEALVERHGQRHGAGPSHAFGSEFAGNGACSISIICHVDPYNP